MISINEALEHVAIHSKPSQTVKLALSQSNGFILAKDTLSPINMPPFRQSAMDGYAINTTDTNTFILTGEIKAGDEKQAVLKPGEAVRIFTGAPVPDTANTVIMQEKVTANGNTIQIEGTITDNLNIRPLGEQVKKGDIALKKGTKLTPAAIGYLTSLGITEILVYKKPTIAIVATGNELVEAGQPLKYGQIYESNATMLSAALQSLDYTNISTFKIEDNYDNTYKLLKDVITNHDLVLITGGISVGDYDFVGKALNELQVKQVFYKVKQKPGKPLFFGTTENTLVFALPGNPAAALSCFYIYVYTALQRISGIANYELIKTTKKSTASFIKKGDRPQFLKAIATNNDVTILEGQSSAMLQTFALANALVFIPEQVTQIEKGDNLEVILIPNTN